MTFNWAIKTEQGVWDFSLTVARRGCVIGCAEMVPENHKHEKSKVKVTNPKYVKDCKINQIWSGFKVTVVNFLVILQSVQRIKMVHGYIESPRRTMGKFKMNLKL